MSKPFVTLSDGISTMLIGYARVSTTDQDCTIQRQALAKAGCDPIREEQKSGTKLEGRAELKTILDFIGAGDVLVCTRLDRLARSVKDLQDIVHALKAKGASLKCIEQAGIDMTTSSGKLFLDLLGSFAEFETALRKERQREGIDKAKEAGVYNGRPKTIDPAAIAALKKAGKGASEIAKELGINRRSVYRALGEAVPS